MADRFLPADREEPLRSPHPRVTPVDEMEPSHWWRRSSPRAGQPGGASPWNPSGFIMAPDLPQLLLIEHCVNHFRFGLPVYLGAHTVGLGRSSCVGTKPVPVQTGSHSHRSWKLSREFLELLVVLEHSRRVLITASPEDICQKLQQPLGQLRVLPPLPGL